MAWIAGAVAALWLVWNAVRRDQRIYQAGPLSAAHSMFEKECSRCHTESWQPALRLVSGNTRFRSVPDSACTRCHDGPIHHDQQIGSDVPQCADCHGEHRGRSELAKVSDARCVACHADLKTTSRQSRFDPHVASFATTHPEFSVLKRGEPDRAAIKLNHQVHLNPEGVLTNAGPREVLACDSCHQPDAQRRLMKPIDHQAHCSRCHFSALVFDSGRFAEQPAPHRDPETVRAVVRERYRDLVRQHPDALGDETNVGSERQVPGRSPGRAANKAEWEWVEDRVSAAERILFEGAGGCRFCHDVSRTRLDWQVAKPDIPQRWLPQSLFRHDSHRMLACVNCHAGATSSTHTTDVLLPSIETCRSCHVPTRGARSDCIECHTYHDKSRERSFDGLLNVKND